MSIGHRSCGYAERILSSTKEAPPSLRMDFTLICLTKTQVTLRFRESQGLTHIALMLGQIRGDEQKLIAILTS